MYGIDYLFNAVNEKGYYEPKEIKSAFDGSYILSESRGDKDNKLDIHKDIFACLFSIHKIIRLSCHEQVCLSGLHFKRYFSHHRAR